MSYDLTEVHYESLILLRISGTIDDAQMFELLTQLVRLESYPRYHQLFDFQAIENYDITPEGLREYSAKAAEYVSQYDAEEHRKVAIVVGQDVQFGMGRVFIAHMEQSPGMRTIFRSRQEAIEWLEIDNPYPE